MIKVRYPACARCPTRVCENWGAGVGDAPSFEKAPAFCPMKLVPDISTRALSEYNKPEVREFACLASIQEAECYERLHDGIRTRLPRIEELIQFSRKCGYKRLGIAHCGGLFKEAGMLSEILENNGFEVVTVQCKTGAVQKENIGIPSDKKIALPGDWESMCNPIAQAMIINKAGVDLAVMLGLCIGHDTLFIKYCDVPLTVIAVKDRVFGHNPLAALYLSDSYYRRLKNKID